MTDEYHAGTRQMADLAAHWDRRYSGTNHVWTGKVNEVLADIVSDMKPGSALDLGCGEGADIIWLAKRGWRALGVDISQNAVARARRAARDQGVNEERARFLVGNLLTLGLGEEFDLVTASFFNLPLSSDRADILRAAATLVVPGGHIRVVSHAAMPLPHGRGPTLYTPEEEVQMLDLDPGSWEPVTVERRPRTHTRRDGVVMEAEDSVVLYQRRG